jgi:hypothetical protein
VGFVQIYPTVEWVASGGCDLMTLAWITHTDCIPEYLLLNVGLRIEMCTDSGTQWTLIKWLSGLSINQLLE